MSAVAGRRRGGRDRLGPGVAAVARTTGLAISTVRKGRRGARGYPFHFDAIADGHGDATTGDVLIQCAIFGDIVYG